MPGPISAVDAISPAFSDARRMLFAPWKLAMWSRMAVLGLLTGEFAGGGWSGGTTNFNFPQHRGHTFNLFNPISQGGGIPAWVRHNEMWLALLGVLLVALFFLAEYLASVSRFILFDSVVTGRCQLRSQWRRWRRQGVRFFWWDVGFSLVCVAGLVLLVGIPLWMMVRKLPPAGERNIGALLAGGFLIFFAFLIYLILVGVIDLVARDFLVPVMAVENCGVWSGWRRFLGMLDAEKLAYAGYVLMKIVLSIGSAILFGIADLAAMLFLLIPLGMVGVGVYFLAHGMHWGWSFATVSGLVLLVALAVAVVVIVFAFLYAPGLVFFESYTLRFLASRFPALAAAMNPPPPPASLPPAGPLRAEPLG